jgi:hypothetical protein
LYGKNWEDGLIDSGGWGHQDNDTLSCPYSNGICYGDVSNVTAAADGGTHSGRISLPANTSYRQGVTVLHNRTVQNHQDEWFAAAVMFPTGWKAAMTNPDGSTNATGLFCPNYYSVNGCTDNVNASNNSIYVLFNAGACPASGVSPGCPYYMGNALWPAVCRGFSTSQCGMHYIVQPGALKENVWYEIIFHVYYTLDLNGVVQAWHREKGQSSWSLDVNVQGAFPTLQTGPTSFGTTVTASNINGWSSTDQIILYRPPASNAVSSYNDNWCRATSFAAAASCFP